MASLADMIRQNKMRPIDQNPLLGKVSSVLGSAREYGNKVNLPVLGGLGDMFVGKAPEEIENWSYGNSPFQSTEMGLPQIKRERKQSLVDALSTLAGPVSGLAKATEELPVGMSIKNVANKNLNAELLQKYLSTGKLSPQEMAQYEANGLTMETPNLQRYNVENAMANPEREAYKNSLDLPMYHGSDTELKIIKPFAKRGDLGSLYASGVPSTANEYAMLGAQLRNHVPEHLWDDEEFMAEELADLAHKTQKIAPNRNPNVLSLLGKSKNAMNAEDDFSDFKKYINSEYPDELNMDYDTFFTTGGHDAYILENANNYLRGLQTTGELSGYTGEKNVPLIKFTPDPETGTNTYVVQEPHNVRSRFAAFDPLRKNSSSLLASLVGAIGLANQYDKEKKLKDMQ